MRRTLVGALALFAVLVPPPARAIVPVVVIDGRGFGHGVGMAQEGAFWMGAAGASTAQILEQFYPAAGIGRARGPVRVPVLDVGPAPSSVVVAFPGGGEIRESAGGPPSSGFPVRVAPGGQARITFDGARYRADVAGGQQAARARSAPLGPVVLASNRRPHGQVPTLPPPPSSTSTTSPPPTAPSPAPSSTTTSTTAPPDDPGPGDPGPGDPGPGPGGPPPSEPAPPAGPTGPTSTRPLAAIPAEGTTVAVPDRQRQYRGYVEATATTGTLRLVNTVDVETYLKGMGEVRDPSWPQASLRAQAIAARTYALRAMAVGGEVCDTERCQVYLGAQAEYAAMNNAVESSREQVLVHNRALISAVYSANGGGHSASREEGFGVADDASAPYLRPAPYPTNDPGPWSVTVALTDVAARLGYAGDLTDVRVGRSGPSGRAIEVVLDGSAGPKAVTGIAFDAALGLRSTLFTLRLDAGEAPPPPPPAEDVLVQAPPEEAAAAAVGEVGRRDDAIQAAPGPLRPGGDEDAALPEEMAIFAAWALLAAVAAVVVLRPAAAPSTPPPSPSARRTEDDSP